MLTGILVDAALADHSVMDSGFLSFEDSHVCLLNSSSVCCGYLWILNRVYALESMRH